MAFLGDFRYALRMLRKNPWFSAAIIVTLALGIGVNTTVFTLVNAVLFKPLPFPGGERLVIVRANNIATGRGSAGVSLADIEDFRKAATSLERLEAFNGFPLNLSEAGNPPERYRGGRVTPGLFAMLQERPVLGRSFVESDAAAGAEPVIVIGYKIWADRYGLRKDVIGKPVLINGKPATVVGVMGEGFRFPNNEDGWVIATPDEAMMKRDNRMFMAIGMIRPGASLAAANADLATVAARLAREYPDSHKDY
jgi:putative ABC transport system permease protein